MRYPLCITLLVWAATAHAETLTGRVVGVSDGDTLTVLIERQQVKVRINAIDAPEKKQAYGERSKQNLSAMAFGKDARLDCHKKDRYGRQVCKVWVQPASCPTCGQTLDVGLAQIVAGMAWWYREYAKEQTPEDRGRYESEENEAKLRKRGLWSAPNPTPPWEWRKLEWDRKGVAPVAPSEAGSSPAVQAQPQAAPRKWVCDRKEVKGQDQVAIECGRR